MTQAERRLLRHLVVAVLIKLVVLVVLWHLFVRDARVSVDTDRVAAQMGRPSIPQGASK